MTKHRVKRVCTRPFRDVGFADRNSASRFELCDGGIGGARHVGSKNWRAIGCFDTGQVVVIFHREGQSPECSPFGHGNLVFCQLRGPVMSGFQTQGRQCINDRIHRGDSLCNGIEYIERRKITTVQLAADFARAERNEFVVVHGVFIPE